MAFQNKGVSKKKKNGAPSTGGQFASPPQCQCLIHAGIVSSYVEVHPLCFHKQNTDTNKTERIKSGAKEFYVKAVSVSIVTFKSSPAVNSGSFFSLFCFSVKSAAPLRSLPGLRAKPGRARRPLVPTQRKHNSAARIFPPSP